MNSGQGRVWGVAHHVGWGLGVAALVTVALVRILGTLLGCRGISHGALGL